MKNYLNFGGEGIFEKMKKRDCAPLTPKEAAGFKAFFFK
jgi:hypothetical protein